MERLCRPEAPQNGSNNRRVPTLALKTHQNSGRLAFHVTLSR